jgi:hypothetical protein
MGLLSITVVAPSGCVNVKKMIDLQNTKDYIYFLLSYNKYIKAESKAKYVDAFIRYADKYKLPDAGLIARQIMLESCFNEKAIGLNGELGCAQLKPQYHQWLIPSLEHYTNTVPVSNQFHNIYIGVEAQCWLMSNYYHRYKDINTALICYWKGEYSAELKNYTNKKYAFTNTLYYSNVVDKRYCDSLVAMYTNVKAN